MECWLVFYLAFHPVLYSIVSVLYCILSVCTAQMKWTHSSWAHPQQEALLRAFLEKISFSFLSFLQTWNFKKESSLMTSFLFLSGIFITTGSASCLRSLNLWEKYLCAKATGGLMNGKFSQAKTSYLLPRTVLLRPLTWSWHSRSFLAYQPSCCPPSQVAVKNSHLSQELVVPLPPVFLLNTFLSHLSSTDLSCSEKFTLRCCLLFFNWLALVSFTFLLVASAIPDSHVGCWSFFLF